MSAELLKDAERALGEREALPEDLRVLAAKLVGALEDVMRVAVSSGERLPTPSYRCTSGAVADVLRGHGTAPRLMAPKS
ncbi:hypothetical protein ACIHCQ_03255 [Streptomyces sp. NPDC052236]|uniref:hypothetical protein n=1 Tax=Streptomyces sp. NPDC052236 TaxID=3365686 RepID=UPI0037CF36B6